MPTYSDGDLVPPVDERCGYRIPRSGHWCKQHHTHAGDHKCLCGKRWPKEL